MAKHYSTSVVIVYGDRVLLRPNGRKVFQLIGGKANKGESPIETGEREALEESGLRLDRQKMEKIHEERERGRKHTFYLYRLTESEVNNALIPNRGERRPTWHILPFLRMRKMFIWAAYRRAIQMTRKRLMTNLLTFNPSPALV